MSSRSPLRLLQSKLSPPWQATTRVPRTALIDRLTAIHCSARSILLEAPAGYGKTMLMEQMFEARAAAGTQVAWLTLDGYDTRPLELVRYLAAAFAKAGLLSGNPTTFIDELPHDACARAALDALLEAAAHSSREAIVFLDDLQALKSPECLALVSMLIGSRTTNLRFVVASRAHPAIDVARLVVQGGLKVLTGRHIRFSRSEIATLLGPECTPDMLAVLDEKTHGWPVALQLLQAAVRQAPDSLQEFVGCVIDIPGVAEYLNEQVMAYLPQDVQRFLMVTSLPVRLTGELANQLCERSDGWRVLAQLAQSGLFLVPLGAPGEGYRYCDFFREFLRKRLARETTLDALNLHRKAAQVCFATARFEDALRHSIEAADWNMAIRIMEDEGSWHLGLQHGSGALQGMQAIPAAFIQRSLGARLALIYLILHDTNADIARELFEALRRESLDFTRWQGAAIEAAQATDCRALDAMLVLCEEKPLAVDFVERIKTEARAQGTRGHFVRVLAENSLSIYAHHAAGRYHDCSRLGQEALVGLKRINANFGLGYVYIYLGMSQFALGRAQHAQAWYSKAFNFAAVHFPNEAQRLEALACIAETNYYQGDVEAARKNIGAVLAGLKQQSEIDSGVCQGAYLTAASLQARAGTLDAALAALMEARAIARYMQREQRVAIIDIRRVEELTRGGRYADAHNIILQNEFQRALNEPEMTGCIPLVQMQAAIAIARYELASGNIEGARARLLRLTRQAQAHHNELIKLRCLLLLAAAQFAAEARAEALQSLRSFCSRVIPSGLRQIVIEDQAMIQPVLDCLLQSEPVGTVAYANAEVVAADWLPDADAASGDSPPQAQMAAAWLAAPGILSPRQREVLELLAAGLSGKEIATQLSLSESTIKSYRKSLYAKLRAGRRSQALANARRMLLLAR